MPRLPLRSLSAALLAASLVIPATALADPLQRATDAFDQGDLRTAEVALKALLQQDPGVVEARLLLGRTYLRLGDGASAAKEFERALELGADAGTLRFDLVESLLQQGKFDDALARLDLTAIPPDQQASAQGLRGRALIGLERLDEARTAFADAVALDPNDRIAGIGLAQLAMMDEDADTAAATIDRLLAAQPDDPDLMLLRAEIFRQQQDGDGALAQFGQLLDQEPENLRALLGRATVLVGMNRFEEARADLSRVDALRPDIVVVSYLRGVMAFYERDWQAANTHLTKVLGAQPSHVQSTLLMGIVSYARDELQLAEEYLSRIMRALPDNLQAAKVLAATRLKLREPKRAAEVLEPFAAAGDPQIMALLGSAYMLAGDQVRGQDWLARAVETAPDVAALRTQLALTLIAGGQVGDAITELESAVDLGQDVLQADVLLVLALLKEQQFEEAIAASTALEQRRPDSPVAFNLTGLALLAQGRFDDARERFDRALALDPAFTTALINLARADVARDDLDGAQDRYRSVLDQEPKNLAALLGMAALAELRGEPERLEHWLNQAQDANPNATQPGILLTRFNIDRGDYLKALTVASDLGARFPKNPEVLEMLGRAQTLADQESSAVRSFDQAIELRPEDPRLFHLKGGALWKANDHRAAADAFRRAIALKPDYVDARVALASVLLAADRHSEAVTIAQDLQRDYPDNPLGFRLEARIQTAASDHQAAIAALVRALELAPAADTARELAEVYTRANDSAQAIEVLRRWTAQAPDDLESLSLLALLFQGEGRDEDALPIYLRIYEADQAGPVVLNNLAWILQQRGDPRALEIARSAYEIAPNRPEIADTFGWILYQSGRQTEGLNILQQAHLAYPTQTEIAWHVAVALDGLGRGNEAVNILRRLLQEYPNAPEATDARAMLERLSGTGAG